MLLVDTHCHLDFAVFKCDLDSVIQRSIINGVYRIIIPGLNLNSSRIALELADRYEPVFAAVGVHPSEVDSYSDYQILQFEEMLKHPKVVAVGEVGLDYYHRQDNQVEQLRILRFMLELAQIYKKPLILHSRNSMERLINEIGKINLSQTANKISGVYHSFEGTLSEALAAGKQGFFIGAGGPITYKNATTKHQVFSKIELSGILLETDSPFLSPQPFRGNRNEPSRIPIIAGALAVLQGRKLEEVADTTTQNARNLFNWKE